MAKHGQAVLWTAVGAILAGSLGILGILFAARTDPDTIKADFALKLAALEAMTADEAVRRDAIAEELLAVEDYQKHARSLILKLERLHPKLHEAAKLDRRAQKEVPPWLARCKGLDSLPLEELQLCAGDGRSLLGNYSSTRFAAPLKEALDRIEGRSAVLRKLRQEETGNVSPEAAFVDLHRKVRKAVEGGRPDEALLMIADFEKLSLGAVFTEKLRDMRDYVKRSGARTR